MDRRVELHNILVKELKSRNVYFQPPESFKLQYPCIVYSLAAHNDIHADNRAYFRMKQYNMTYITKDPDDPMVDKLDDLQYCSLGHPFISENLHHFPYTIYY